MGQDLKAKKVLISRPEEGAEEFRRKLEFKGAEIVSMPLIQLQLIVDQSQLNHAFSELENYDWVVFNSSAAVRFFFQRAEEQGLKMYFYPDLKIATVGEKTKLTLEQLGYRTNFVPIQYTAEVLAANMPDIEGKRILIPASELTAGNYLEVFRKRGAKAELITLYENREVIYGAEEIANILKQPIDYLTFTSGSTVDAFENQLGNPQRAFPDAKVICIGPSTAATAKSFGWQVDGIAEPHSVEGMIACMEELAEKEEL